MTPMRLLAVAVLAACSKPATTPGSGSGSGSTVAPAKSPTPVDATTPAHDAAAPAIDAATAAKRPATAPCLIADDAHYGLGRIGGDLVACGGDWTDPHCFTIDRKTGALTPRTETALPGAAVKIDPTTLQPANCYQGYCWTALDDETTAHERIEAVANPDGKQIAMLVEANVSIFDVATKKKRKATIDAVIGAPTWFVGDVLLVQFNDAGPHAAIELHDAHGKKLYTFEGTTSTGGVGTASDGTIVVQEDSLSTVTVIDNKWATRKTISRAMPKAPCSPDEPMVEPDSKDPRIVACIKYTAKYYTPYENASAITDGDGFSALVGTELVALDAKLVETARLKLAACPKH